ncbi:MAG: nitrogenase component 1 [Eggerthellaceae bacterium]|nr:nitrogenase component 1 [Eggerthellaceae bacterium]
MGEIKPLIKPAGSLADLNVNPCKMCMPMGSSTAAYGLKRCVTILHGSQGCATYIRRHMATHYNEPVDIASSALTEQGTVYGGEANLHKGIDNLIRLYDPEVICVSTTCLAETIGEDVPAMLERWREKNPESTVEFVPVTSPGYGGSQFGGYFRFLRSMVEHIDMKPEAAKPHQLNVILGPMSPADTRTIKELIGMFGIDAVVVPDISYNLDRPRLEVYDRTPAGGTPISDVKTMAGSALTIELSTFVSHEMSAGAFLWERYGVPCVHMAPPVALRDIDLFLDELSKFAQVPVPEPLRLQRGRSVDAMIDSHKYNAEGRAAIFGEPDFCYAMVRLCAENGIVPVVVAAGSPCAGFVEAVKGEVRSVAKRFLVDRWSVMDDADFGDIERLALENGANVMIGSSDGRRIEEKHRIPLVRCAFPIHDHIGGQRIRTMGYEGSLMLLDRITNALLQRKHVGFRAAIRDEFYDNSLLEKAHLHREEPVPGVAEPKADAQAAARSCACKTEEAQERQPLRERSEAHPCFNEGSAADNARIHLPVAPACNISCNYCVRDFDCVNESRPGVCSTVLSPREALEHFKEAKEKIAHLTTVGIAGPGDALANWKAVRETIELVRGEDPQVLFCLSTNGLLLPRYADELARLGVTHVTVTMNAADPVTAGKVYKRAVLDGICYQDAEAGAVLLANQCEGIKRLVALGVVVKVNTVVIAGVNDNAVEDVARLARRLGASIHNLMGHIPVAGSAFEDLPRLGSDVLCVLRAKCRDILPQMKHCRQCRADAVGTLQNDLLAFLSVPNAKEPMGAKGDAGGRADASGMKTARAAAKAGAGAGGLAAECEHGHARECLNAS